MNRIFVVWKRYGAGVWSGLFAALMLVTVSLVLRWSLGIGTLLELLGDRIAPLLGLHLFFFLIGFFQSYVRLKEFGIVSMLLNEVGAGVIFGLLYAWLARRDAAKAKMRLYGAVGIAFIGLTVFLWGNLITNYFGLRPAQARPLSIAGLLVSAVLFAWAIPASHALLTAT